MTKKKKKKTFQLRYEPLRESEAFKVVIYGSELRQILAWTAKFPNLETGGDLFGLWLDENTAVVQLVLGPGKNCKRTATSFYQDINYLERVGSHLTNKEGLCHIGEWHSHHRLGLTRPSGGDENTVWSNMRRYGIHRFVLFIATIDSSWSKKTTMNGVNIDGYLFQINKQNVSNMPLQHSSYSHFEKISTKSPFRVSSAKEIKTGAESLNTDDELSSTEEDAENPSDEKCLTFITNQSRREEFDRDEENERNSSRCQCFWTFCEIVRRYLNCQALLNMLHNCSCIICLFTK